MKNAAIFTSQSYQKVSLKLSLFYKVSPPWVSWSVCMDLGDCWEISNSNWPIFHLNNTKHTKSYYSLGPSPCQKCSAPNDNARFPPRPSAGPGSAFCKFKCFLFQMLLNFRSFCSQDGPSTHVETTDLPSPLCLFFSSLLWHWGFSSGFATIKFLLRWIPRLQENINVRLPLFLIRFLEGKTSWPGLLSSFVRACLLYLNTLKKSLHPHTACMLTI